MKRKLEYLHPHLDNPFTKAQRAYGLSGFFDINMSQITRLLVILDDGSTAAQLRILPGGAAATPRFR
jgi:hypothetical protein